MMKRVISLILICLIITFVFAGCAQAPVGDFVLTENETIETETPARFREIGREKINSGTGGSRLEDSIYYVDIYTNIVYVYFIDWDTHATRGMMTVLYNADGAPMTLEEFLN